MDKKLLTITGCRDMLQRREISAAELTELYLERISACDEQIGAYLTVCAKEAAG